MSSEKTTHPIFYKKNQSIILTKIREDFFTKKVEKLRVEILAHLFLINGLAENEGYR